MNKDIFSSESEQCAGQKSPSMMPKWVRPFVAVLVVIVMLVSGIFIGLAINNVSLEVKQMSKDMPLLEEIYSYLEKYYYKDISWDERQEMAGAGLAALDRFSGLSLTSAEETPLVGITLQNSIHNESYISRIAPNSPASTARGKLVDFSVDRNTKKVTISELSNINDMILERGDKIVAIKNNFSGDKFVYAEYLGNENFSDYMTANIQLALVVMKTDGKYMQINLNRTVGTSNPIGLYTNLGSGVGHIALYSFSYDALDNIFELFGEFINDSSATKLILNLNDNGGGDIRVLQEIATFVIPYENKKSLELIQTDGKLGERFFATESTRSGISNNYLGGVKGAGFKLAILTNGNSASASEALTGAVMAYNPSAFIVGSPTYGKGVTQATFLIYNDQYYLSIVSGYFYIPQYNANGTLEWKTSHERPLVPKYNVINEDRYGMLYNDISQEVDVKKAMELLNS